MEFKTASRQQLKARIGIAGISGSGKSFSSILVARGIIGEDAPLAVICTEGGRANLYADLTSFDVLTLRNPSPEDYAQAIEVAAAQGYQGLVIDGISPEWQGSRGVMAQVDKFQDWARAGRSHSAFWRAIQDAPLHIVCTVRSKSKFEMVDGKVLELGEQPIQRGELSGSDVAYELDIFGRMAADHTLHITASRCPELDGTSHALPGIELGAEIRAWLDRGDENPLYTPVDDDTRAMIEDALRELEEHNPAVGAKAREHYESRPALTMAGAGLIIDGIHRRMAT